MKKRVSIKKKPAAKRVPKKPSTKRVPKPQPAVNSGMAMVTIPYEQISKPETYNGHLSVIPTPFNERQLLRMIRKTPQEVVLKRPGKGGKQFDYIPGWWFRKELNFTFGWMHDFEILTERIDGDFITVKGKLTIKDKTGKEMITKTDFGGHPVNYKKDMPHKPENYVDISNDFKAAATDCLKRCAVQLGFGLDVYSQGDYQQGDQPLQPQVPQNFKQGSNVHVMEIPKDKPVESSAKKPQVEKPRTQAQPVQTDYIAKLNKYLDEHPKGPFTVREKIQFVKERTKIFIPNWGAMQQLQAQLIIATLIRNGK